MAKHGVKEPAAQCELDDIGALDCTQHDCAGTWFAAVHETGGMLAVVRRPAGSVLNGSDTGVVESEAALSELPTVAPRAEIAEL